MYQAAASEAEWSHKEIPLWFREGFASWTAHQAGKRLSREALARALRARPALDPLRDGETRYRTEEAVVYASAHWAFALLVARGEAKVATVLSLMHDGFRFPAAFAQAYGEDPEIFENLALAVLREGGEGRGR